ncbi:hypothetical protein LPBF_12020 [Flavobacterium crassostreae]|uniref:Uncharacterized protein n=2 Tax=Flavobacterium crassostreae TaxID=1763534 RepID=A0A1B9DL63_9FLAO|nr:hypothetical protein LPBF_12020 [Flavobacterium crassostreae]
MKNLFDYTFYRTAKRHFKSDGAKAFTACLSISFIVFLYCASIYYFIINLIKFRLSLFFDKIIFVFIAFLIFYVVRRKYKGKYFVLRDKWIKETKKEKLFGEVLIVVFFFSPLLLMFVIKFLFK